MTAKVLNFLEGVTATAHWRYDFAGQLVSTAPELRPEVDFWTDGDRLRLPRVGHALRRKWNATFDRLVHEAYDHMGRLKPEVFVACALSRTNRIANEPRYEMYRRMVAAGETLPPIVVDEHDRILDGNHRTQATCDEGVELITGYRIIPEGQ